MMKCKKILSLFLAVLMLCSAMTGLSVMTVFADETTAGGTTTTPPEAPTVEETMKELYTEVFASPEEKLATMKPMYDNGKYTIYVQELSGEVAIKDLRTNQVLFTNPYDVGVSTASESVKNDILSQIIVKFEENGREKVFSSFEHAALRDQIKIKNIKNGIRVEYTIGREEARHLVPEMITKERFESEILAPMEEYYGVSYEDALKFKDDSSHPLYAVSFYLFKRICYYSLKDLDACSSDRLKQDMMEAFPITKKFDVYVLDPIISAAEKEKLEEVIKTACPNYTFEELDADHQLTEYTSEEDNPPVFKMALEYTLDDDGFTVRLPANGIRFNEDKFQLTNISILPYMGCGNNAYEGYTFYPDGSGALFAFEDLVDQNTYSVASKIYGTDYAYHKITGATYQQTVRYPVFGIVENTKFYNCISMDETTGQDKTTPVSGLIYDKIQQAKEEGTTLPAALSKYDTLLSNSDVEEVEQDRGFVAIIEEGDALTDLVNYHAGVLSPYDTVQMNFNPRPKDSYNVADAISVGSNSEWTVVSNRKYVGNYKIHYVMLSDEKTAAEEELPTGTWYEATWLGMAKAYRDYLTDPEHGSLKALSSEQTSGDLPLYIESFGSIETVEKILSIPVEVKKPLTSAKDVISIYEELSKAGATNINFKLTGFANGGVLYSTIPYNLKWERAVSKEVDMQELFDYAANLEAGNLGLYPDFDFSYVVETKMFDGFTLRKHAVRTIDDRVTYERKYVATQQKYSGMLKLAISPAYFDHFYTKLMKNYLKYDNVTGISVGTLGNTLNSDFDEDEPYNREDSKQFVRDALKYISGSNDGNMSVMVDGGNAYTWEFVDHILNAPLDSSRYLKASYSVPFLGVVLHGYKNFAGTPLNMEGDLNYAKLKAIENGASVYFTLSYQNTQILKEDPFLSEYYSIRYDIWSDDVKSIYNELNAQLKDVQNKLIIDHRFLEGIRVSDLDELDRDILDEFNSVLDYQTNKTELDEKKKAQAVADARDNIASLKNTAQKVVKDNITYYSGLSGAAYKYVGDDGFETRFASYIEAKTAYEKLQAQYAAADEAGKKALEDELATAEGAHRQALAKLKTVTRNVGRALGTIEDAYAGLEALLVEADNGVKLINGLENCPQSIIDEINLQLAETEALMLENMGVTFDMSVDKAEVDTVLRAHIATLIASCSDKNNGKSQDLFTLLQKGEYGLLYAEMDMLRYLESNRNLTDKELADKYGLSENKSSVAGLVKYVTELLGDGYSFDPVVVNVEDHIHDYFVYMLFSTATAIKDPSILSTLNFADKRVNENGLEVTNTTNNNSVINAIKAEIDKVLTGDSAILGSITDGEYDLDKVFTPEQMDSLKAACVEIINKNIRTEQTAIDPSKAVIYETPETMADDVERFIRSYYYKKAIGAIAATDEVTLLVQTVNSKTDASISMLVAMKKAEYAAAGAVGYKALYEAMKNDADLDATLNRINESVKGAYGDVLPTLRASFENAFVLSILGTDKAPAFSTTTRKEPVVDENGDPVLNEKGEQKTQNVKLSDEVKKYLADKKIAESTEAEIAVMIADVVAIHGKYDASKITYDVQTRTSDYFYFHYLGSVANASLVFPSYYFDEQMAQMDAAVLAKVAAKHDEILAELGSDFTAYELYAAILSSFVDPEDSAADFVADVTSKITHVAQGKYSLEEDVLNYYYHALFDSFKEYTLTEENAPKVPIDPSKNYKYAMDILDDYLTKDDKKNKVNSVVTDLLAKAKEAAGRGQAINYDLDSFLTEEELDAIVTKMGEQLGRNRYYNCQPNDKEGIAAETAKIANELEAYLRHSYYMAVAKRLKVNSAPSFHVSDVYADTLQIATMQLKELMYYFVSMETGMSYKEIDVVIAGTGTKGNVEGDEEEESSRYLSNDGRIVSVTYGDKNADGSYSAYKTFILNYNNFSVNVTYDGVTYTIPAYGYVVV